MLIDVAIPVPLHTTFSYAVPESLTTSVCVGARVRVPFRRKQIVGIVTALNSVAPAHAKIKEIIDCIDTAPIISETTLSLCRWISQYYAAPIGEMLQSTLPPHLWRTQKRKVSSRLMEAHTSHVQRGSSTPPTLNIAQEAAKVAIGAAITAGAFAPFLLHGVTGSGKTEVYLAACTHAMALGRQAIILVPEIALTPQLLGRFVERFGETMAVYHSGLTEAQRMLQWQRIRTGEAQIVVGTRSAIFAPVKNLGLIIVDEEHDSSYKQDDSPRYNGRDVAVMRAKLEDVPIVLGSATPAIESYANARHGKYQLLKLAERAAGQAMPKIQIVDMRELKEKRKPLPIFSPQLLEAISQRLAANEQTLLLVNRRGFARFIVCEECGHISTCPNCDVSLAFHQGARELRCHYCDYHTDSPDNCPSCHSLDIKPVGTGTERLEETLKEQFPTARIGRLDSDTIATQHNRTQVLQDMHDRNIDILVGTQMIAKGHDFSHVTLVGVIAAETGLNVPDFRASERCFQLLMQASGRAGRAHLEGNVILQTLQPEHGCLTHLITHDYIAFADGELQHREELRYPPFGRLINCTIATNVEKNGLDYAEALATALSQQIMTQKWPATLLGPAPALMYKLRGKTRMQLLLKLETATLVPHLTRAILQHQDAHAPSGIQLTIDVDPMNIV